MRALEWIREAWHDGGVLGWTLLAIFAAFVLMILTWNVRL